MEFNQLPEDRERPQKRRTEFDSTKEKLDYDAKNFIAIAKAQAEKLGQVVDPLTLSRRADDDVEALRSAIAKQSAVNPVVVASTTEAAESVEVDQRLTTFKTDFDADPTIGAKISWTEIQTHLLAKEGHYLALAQGMEQGGQLFGVDAEGRPLISDRGDEPIMNGMNYKNTRNRVLYKHDRNDIKGEILKDEAGKPISTGYEMFPYVEPYEKSNEIKQYEAHTGKHFVQSPDKRAWRSSWLESGEKPSWPRSVYSAWLESGEKPSWPRSVYSALNREGSYVAGDFPKFETSNRGVRRLLRVEKA